jgi:hypothetical protein
MKQYETVRNSTKQYETVWKQYGVPSRTQATLGTCTVSNNVVQTEAGRGRVLSYEPW